MSAAAVDSVFVLFFFFQAEDGIRDLTVTGVQTCALPICTVGAWRAWLGALASDADAAQAAALAYEQLDASGRDAWIDSLAQDRSEERRVGKECRSRWSP